MHTLLYVILKRENGNDHLNKENLEETFKDKGQSL